MSASRKKTVVDAQVDGAQRLFRCILTAYPQTDALGAGLHRPGRRNCVLRLQALNHLLPIQPQTGDLFGGDIEVDDLVLRTDQVDLSGARDLENVGARLFGVVAQLTERKSVGRKGIDDPIDVAELVVEERPLHPRRQFGLDVGDLVADQNPGRADLGPAHVLIEVDEDRRLSGRRVAVGVIEVAKLLELALDPVGHLVDHLVDSGARPVGLDDHGLDGERRVFLAAKPLIRQDPADQRSKHQVPHERAVLERPFGQVEPGHWLASRILTAWPGDRL